MKEKRTGGGYSLNEDRFGFSLNETPETLLENGLFFFLATTGFGHCLYKAPGYPLWNCPTS